MWDLKSVNKNTYSCFQYLIATIAKWYKLDYRLMMLELWGFQYNNSVEGQIGDKLGLCWTFKNDRRNKLLGYHRLWFEVRPIVKTDILGILKDQLLLSPVGITMDSYYCTWLPFYQKIHRPHSLILTGNLEDQFIFIDQYTDDCSKNILEHDFIANNASQIIFFKVIRYDTSITLEDHIIDSIINWENNFMFVQYTSFIKDMKNSLNISNEIEEDPVASKLVMYLKNISDDRMNLIEAMNLFEEKLNCNLREVVNTLYDISLRYEKIRAYIIKCSFSKRAHKPDIISNELDIIYDSEQKIYHKIRTIFMKKNEAAL